MSVLDFKANRTVSRRNVLGYGAAAGAVLTLGRFTSAWAAGADNLTGRSASEVAKLIATKQISAVDAVKACYARIDAVNPKLNAVVAFCRERALYEAQQADAMLAAGKSLGPLHGVPFTIKDSFDSAGLVSTGGTLGRKNFIPGKDATVLARARAAGAILLGKTNPPEFTLGGGGKGTVNLVYGLTKNAYNTDYQPSGSSGGAGAIVAAGGSFFDIGSDYGGSIRGPAYANGIAGIKPTLGRTPRTGHIVGYGGPFDSFQETGPLARRVEDIALLLPILAGPDNWDALMAPVPLGDPGKVELGKLRVAYYTSNGQMDPTAEVQALVKQCVAYFTKLGCKVKEDKPPKMAEVADVRSKFNGADGREHIRRMLRLYGTTQSSPGLRIDGDVVSSAEFTRLCEAMDAIRSEQLQWLEQYDLIVCPASQRAPAGGRGARRHVEGRPGPAAGHPAGRAAVARRRGHRGDGARRKAGRRLAADVAVNALTRTRGSNHG